jgi:Xaa-Pro aminopeptidase
MNGIQRRISGLRTLMRKRGLAAYVVPNTDEHQNEYTPENKKRRQWMSGFTGSSGDLIVFETRAWLWTDSRYFIQAELELAGSGIELLKAGVIEYADVYEWSASVLKQNDALGIDPALVTYEDFTLASTKLSAGRIKLKAVRENLVDVLWRDRIEQEAGKAEIHSLLYCGESYSSKLSRLREKMSDAGCKSHIISSPDSVCWLFNVRGHDVQYNPVLISHAVVTEKEALLFVDENKVSEELRKHLLGSVNILPYDDFFRFCRKLANKKEKVWIDPKRTSYAVASVFEGRCELSLNESPVAYYKALKNETELSSLAESMKKDGTAMVRFLCWLDANVRGGSVTEESAARRLGELRAENEGYAGPSFHTISAFGEHGAIVHYSYTSASSIPIAGNGLYLVDSGAHYPGGTTDITRTISIGNPTPEQKALYTCVLKGHIALATARFPKGTKGVQLDTLARKPLWDLGLDYGHGTGHGVGFYLNVHEGPQSISSSKLSAPGLEPGMLVSDEPGYYKRGGYGIRIENILLVVEDRDVGESDTPFYRFRTMTLCPYEKRLIEPSLLAVGEALYIDLYHAKIKETLINRLESAEERAWLETATTPILGSGAEAAGSLSNLF